MSRYRKKEVGEGARENVGVSEGNSIQKKRIMNKEKTSWKEGLEWLRTVLPLLFVIGGIGFMIFSVSSASIARDFVYAGSEYYGEFFLLYAIYAMLISIGSFLLAILIRVW